MTSRFKNIILFTPESEKTKQFKSQLENIKYIRLFETSDIDEVQQIIDMSEKAVIVVDDGIAANKFFKATLNKKKARFKKFYLSWHANMPKGLSEKLIEQDFAFVSSDDIHTVTERVELYLFGKTNVFSNPEVMPEEGPNQFSFKKGYFSHFEKVDGKWKTIISSHETDDEINTILGKNWDAYLERVLEDASDMKEYFETTLEATSFHELVYPHIVGGKVKKLSIVHVNIDANFASNIMSIYSFLNTLGSK